MTTTPKALADSPIYGVLGCQGSTKSNEIRGGVALLMGAQVKTHGPHVKQRVEEMGALTSAGCNTGPKWEKKAREWTRVGRETRVLIGVCS
ncbi:hypothetical protein TIFTF001_028531 [Ficus carica]|uniref:Uncharacterized protein n=1 Tax=Ficus carica TaxID=3494 RepID=A0AA88DQ89_FICCA|nr:hypothetical protein TIFTF001_028531 [Ficus carica]